MMKSFISPELFQHLAISLVDLRWRLLLWSIFALGLFYVLNLKISFTTPDSLIWLALFILFAALQALVLAAFIFFFQNLPSHKAEDSKSFMLYRAVEWCETLLFAFLLPLPMLIFLYAFIKMTWFN